MKYFLIIFISFFGLHATAQKLDSVKINGAVVYIYPYVQKVDPSSTLKKVLTEKEKEKLTAEKVLINPTFGYDEYMDDYDYELEDIKISKSASKMIRKKAERNYRLYDSESELTPALDVLPNGNYIQYFQPYWRYDDKNELVIVRKKIAGYFTLKNNLTEGKAVWLNLVGDTTKFGMFHNGLKEGEWISNDFDTDDFYIYTALEMSSMNDKPAQTKIENYTNGLLNGMVQNYSDGYLYSTGHYKAGKESGEWFFYETQYVQDKKGIWSDTLIISKHYTLAENKIISHKPFIRNEFSSYNLPYKYFTFPEYYDGVSFGELWEFDKKTEVNLELPEESMSSYEGEVYEDYGENEGDYMDYGDDYLGGDGYENETIESQSVWYNGKYLPISKLIDSIGIIYKYDGIYEEFWENGKRKVRLTFKNGELLAEDTVFWDNGFAADVIVFDPIAKQYENRKMDYLGVLYEVNLYDSLGKFIKKTLDPFYKDKNVMIEGLRANLMESFDNDYSGKYIVWDTYQYDNADTLKTPDLKGNIVLSKSWYNDSTTWKSNVYNADSRTLTEELISINGTVIKQTLSAYDENFNNLMGTSSARLKDLELKSTFNGSYNKEYAFFATDSLAITRINSQSFYEMTEEKILNYQEQPFTGSFVINLNAKSFKTSIVKKSIQIDVTDNRKYINKLKKDYVNYHKTGKTKYPDVFAIATNLQNGYYKTLINIFPDIALLLSANRGNSQANILTMEGNQIAGKYLNGKPNGTWKTIDKKGKTILECTFQNGELEGIIKIYAYAKPRDTKKKKSTPEDEYMYEDYEPVSTYDTLPSKLTYFNSTKIETKNGKLHGDLIVYNWQGKVKSKIHYVNGYSEGPGFDKNAIASTYMNFENGQLDGIIKTYLHIPKRDTILLYELNYQDGYLQGESRSYHTNGKLAKRGFFLDGRPIDDYESYDSLGVKYHYVKFQYSFPVEEKIWESNELSVRYLFDWRDSIYFKPEDITQTTSVDNLMYQYGMTDNGMYQPYYGRPSLVEKTGINYHMTKYFPNDTISRDGDISSGKKTGCWQFYSYDGEKLYEVEYFDTIIKITDSIQFKSKGMLYDFDAKGNLLSRSYIIEKFEKYDCSHSDHYEVRQFYTIWQANDSLHRINGYVKNYYDNGVLQSEGTMKGGLPTGVWKYYDPYGKLNHAGEYKNGKRDGRWLSGDLSKSKYLGDICMNPNMPDLEEQMKYQEKVLDIYIRYFKMGTLVKSEYFGLNLNDYDEEEISPEENMER